MGCRGHSPRYIVPITICAGDKTQRQEDENTRALVAEEDEAEVVPEPLFTVVVVVVVCCVSLPEPFFTVVVLVVVVHDLKFSWGIMAKKRLISGICCLRQDSPKWSK